MLLIVGVAALFRFWQLGSLPPGLYSDEAFNGLDALNVIDGQHALFFEQNNGREPFYIYLTAFAVQIFGRTTFAVRFPAALLGTLTVIPTYYVGKLWFNRSVGLFMGLLWAITVWPIHLSRVGFRSIGLPFMTACFLVAATIAFRRLQLRMLPRKSLFVAGILYAGLFYTYLPARLTPIFLILFLIYAAWQRQLRLRWQTLLWFGAGAVLGILPFVLYGVLNWEAVFGRTGQVSIFSPIINQGDLLGTFWRHLIGTLGMFFWQGDTIVRHNPAGRPVFDIVMSIPFVWGVGWCVWRWRHPAAAAALLWVGTLLWGTILAEDAPHFLRSVGILPILLIFPAISLSRFSNWSKLPRGLSGSIIAILLIISGSLTIRDYFVDYAKADSTYYLFESAARELAEQVNKDQSQQLNSLIDERFAQEWESITFLVTEDMQTFAPAQVVDGELSTATALYAWPHASTNYLQYFIQPPVLVSIQQGGLARGDLEANPYQLYTRYVVTPQENPSTPVANFDNQLHLHAIVLDVAEESPHLSIQLTWSFPTYPARELKAFVHVLDRASMALVAQADAPIGGSSWAFEWWEFDVSVQEQREIILPTRYHADELLVLVGAYDPVTLERLPVRNASGEMIGDSWTVTPNR